MTRNIGTNEDNKVAFGGLQAAYNNKIDFTFFGQFGEVFSPDSDSMSSAGYDKGEVLRLGANYTDLASTSLTFEVEGGRSNNYEDQGEAGEFISLHAGAKTNVSDDSNWPSNMVFVWKIRCSGRR